MAYFTVRALVVLPVRVNVYTPLLDHSSPAPESVADTVTVEMVEPVTVTLASVDAVVTTLPLYVIFTMSEPAAPGALYRPEEVMVPPAPPEATNQPQLPVSVSPN